MNKITNIYDRENLIAKSQNVSGSVYLNAFIFFVSF